MLAYDHYEEAEVRHVHDLAAEEVSVAGLKPRQAP